MFFLLGAIVGSFLNALIYRLPRGISIIRPRSHCPQCQRMISWYQNIPLLSFLFLKGQCAGCRRRIPLRYPLVELITALGAWGLSLQFPGALGPQEMVEFLWAFFVFSAFVAHFFIDLEHHILPDSINALLMALFGAWGFFHLGYQSSLLGGAIGLLFPLGVTYLFYKIRGKIGLGGGDIKLFGALGLALGPMGIVLNLFLSCLLGTIVGLVVIFWSKQSKDTPIAFGPSIIIVSSFQIFFPGPFNDLLSLFLT